ncbi:hypothetical protein BH23THE1_BH23THE1_31480 [soil metagenome]
MRLELYVIVDSIFIYQFVWLPKIKQVKYKDILFYVIFYYYIALQMFKEFMISISYN